MALNDAQLASDLVAAMGSIHAGTAGRDAFGQAIKTYAARAVLTVPGTGLTAPMGPVTGQASATASFTGSALDSALASLFGANHSRSEAAAGFTSAIQAYAATAVATVASNGLLSPGGPLVGASVAGAPSFNGGALTSAITSLYAQDNDTNFAASLLAAAIANYFKSGTMPVVSTYTAPTALGPPGPVVGTATGTIG